MSAVDHLAAFARLIENSFDNTMGAVERSHAAFVALPVGITKELGGPRSLLDGFQERHDRAIHLFYDGVSTIEREMTGLFLRQLDEVDRFARLVNDALDAVPPIDAAERRSTPTRGVSGPTRRPRSTR